MISKVAIPAGELPAKVRPITGLYSSVCLTAIGMDTGRHRHNALPFASKLGYTEVRGREKEIP